jgi:predicted FMN-binding regulatory protein PaiB
MQGEGDFYSVAEAERLLGRTDKPISERRIRQRLQAGDLEGRKDQTGRWHVAQHEVHRLMEERRQEVPESTPGGPENASEMLDRVFMLEREIGRLQGRLELEERAESTVREERDRLLEERDRERARAERLEAELAHSRRSFWSRLLRG